MGKFQPTLEDPRQMKISFQSIAILANFFVGLAFSAANVQKPSEKQLYEACGPVMTKHDDSLTIVKAYFSQSGITAINRPIYNGHNCLHLAACAGKVQVIDYLRTIGANPNETDNRTFVPLHYAVLSNQMAVVDALSMYPSLRVEAENDFKKTPLDYAISVGNKQMVAKLRGLLGKAPYILPDPITRDTLFEAIRTNREGDERNLAVVQEFFRKAGFSRISNPIDAHSRKTLLHLAVIHGKTSIVEYLCANGANPEALDASSRSPLSLATFFGNPSIINILTSRCQNTPVVAASISQAVPAVPQSAEPVSDQVSPRQKLIGDAKTEANSASASLRSGNFNQAGEKLRNALKILEQIQ